MRILFYGGKSHGRHSMNTIAEMLKRGHDVFVLKIQTKSENSPTKVDLTSFKGTNEYLEIDGRTAKIVSLLPGSREIWVCNLRENQKFQEIRIAWTPNVTGLLLQLLLFRAGKLFYEEQLLDSTFLRDRNLLESEKKILNLIELLGLQDSRNLILEFARGQSNFLKLLGNESQELLLNDNSIEALRIASKLQLTDERIKQFLKQLSIESVYTTRNCFGDLFEECLTRTAKDLEMQTFYEVFSWDNLTTKSSILTEPDTYFVWNQTQLFELRSFHRAKSDICITGASRFENLFSAAKVSSAISSSELSILFIGSSPLGCPDDFEVFKRLNDFLKKSMPFPFDLTYRMHKDLERTWELRGNAVLYNSNEFQVQSSESDFLRALSSSDLVFAINTSAVFEVAAQGKSVFRPSFLMDQNQVRQNYHGEYMNKLIRQIDSEIDCVTEVIQHARNKLKTIDSFTRIYDFISPHGSMRRPSEITLDWIESIGEESLMLFDSNF